MSGAVVQSDLRSNNSGSPESISLSNSNPFYGNNNNNAPKYGTLVPNRIFVGGISSNTSEGELCQLFSKYGTVKATKIITDRANVSKGYGFVTFESEEEVRELFQDANNIVLKERKLNIAPAIKKQPSFSKFFDTSSPPPAQPNLCYHNGISYTFHNGMAFFAPTTHHPVIPPMQVAPGEPPVFQAYGTTHPTGHAQYGSQLLVQTPMFLHPNIQYPAVPMTSGPPPNFMYPGQSSANGNSAPPSDSHQLPSAAALPLPIYPNQYLPHPDGYFQPCYPMYSAYGGEFEAQDSLMVDGYSPSPTASQSDASENQFKTRENVTTPNTPVGIMFGEPNPFTHPPPILTQPVQAPSMATQPSASAGAPPANHQQLVKNGNSVPVVSLKHHAEEREMQTRDGRRTFFQAPTQSLISQQVPNPPIMGFPPQSTFRPVYQNSFPNGINMRPNGRFHPMHNKFSKTFNPIIPRFPENFNNNNNTSVINNNYPQKKGPSDFNKGKTPRHPNNNHYLRGNNHYMAPTLPKNPSTPNQSIPSMQVQQTHGQQFERQYGAMSMSTPPPRLAGQPKRVPFIKRQNGPNQNNMAVNNQTEFRLAKKHPINGQMDIGGAGDAQPVITLALTPPGSPPRANEDLAAKMQSLTMDSSK